MQLHAVCAYALVYLVFELNLLLLARDGQYFKYMGTCFVFQVQST